MASQQKPLPEEAFDHEVNWSISACVSTAGRKQGCSNVLMCEQDAADSKATCQVQIDSTNTKEPEMLKQEVTAQL